MFKIIIDKYQLLIIFIIDFISYIKHSNSL